MRFSTVARAVALVLSGSCVGDALAQNAPGIVKAEPHADHAIKAELNRLADHAAAFLRGKQDRATGAWGAAPDGSVPFPAVTGLVVAGLLMSPGVGPDDAAVAPALKFLLGAQKSDGGIYTAALPSYNTAISLAALARVNNPDPRTREAIQKAQTFLRQLQFGDPAAADLNIGEAAQPVPKDHAFHGGWGYGRHGRPDLSNSQWALEALHDSGVPADDPAFQRALVFLQRLQMTDAHNDMPYADGSSQGGFIYATSENKDTVGVGQSFAGTIEETLTDGTRVSRLRAYGGMTYAGFKSYLYAGLAKDDPRVQAAYGWIRRHYTLDENPGLGLDGYYYYLHTFARALSAYGSPTIDVHPDASPDAAPNDPQKADPPAATTRDWRADLAARLASLQQPDGSFKPLDDRWMENDHVLITAYALLALRHAAR
ncbi:MAG: hypothetical protein HRU70_05045 [Phycisphaeraceae bacterium]|nr:MAG: hypothetical protein HRU70_05045 [Phycisphaeraceae bacterium]